MLYYDRIDVAKGIDVIRPANQKSAIFVIIDIFQIKRLNLKQMSAMDAMSYQ